MRKEPENQSVERPSLRPVLLGIAVVVLLMGAMFVADHRRHLISGPEQAVEPSADELMANGDVVAGEILVGGKASGPPEVRFYEVLGQGAAPTGLADAGDADREMPLPPRAEPESAPEPVVVATAEPARETVAETAAGAPEPEAAAAAPSQPAPTPEPVVRTAQTPPGSPQKSSETRAEPEADGPYTLQVASFSRQSGAEELSKRLAKSGFEAYVKSVDLGSRGTWYRVRVGHYPDEDEARWAGLELAREGLNPIVVHEPAPSR